MLPSPALAVNDDRAKLFQRETWGRFPVTQQLLDAGKAFQETIDPVVDGDRMRYIAGYDRETLFRIRVDSPGAFSYQMTHDGDGRVPHESGLLPGVRTFWVEETHGDLPKNEAVLAGIHELLRTGATGDLAESRTGERGVARGGKWEKGESLEDVPPEFDRIVAKASISRGTTDESRRALEEPDAREQARAEALIVRDYLGGAQSDETRKPGARAGVEAPVPRTPIRVPSIEIGVVWGDITRIAADVYAVGHYQGVLPQNAEAALDKAISGYRKAGDPLVITDLTRRGVIRGTLGEILPLPWVGRSGKGRVVAIAGMGRPGTFGKTALRRLGSSLTARIASLPDIQTVAMVLIGSGEGNLKERVALEALLLGMADALAAERIHTRISRLQILERDYGKACRIDSALRSLRSLEDISERIKIRVSALRQGEGGAISELDGLGLLLSAALTAQRASSGTNLRRALATIVGKLPAGPFRAEAKKALEAESKRYRSSAALMSSIRLHREEEEEGDPTQPTRISFAFDGKRISVAALTKTAVIPERFIGIDFSLVEEAVGRMIDPPPESLPTHSTLLARLLMPREFREKLEAPAPIIFELDRKMAQVHWEMLATVLEPDSNPEPVALRVPVARQLRTSYSPPPAPDTRAPGKLRALVVGDPGDPAKGEDLPGARDEALQVYEILQAKGVEVTLMIGPPAARGATRDPKLRGIASASRLEVLGLLMAGGWDIFHYAGHGDFDETDPTRAGWLFQGGLLMSRELERVDVAPRLVVANACLSGRLWRPGSGEAGDARPSEALLLPSLADEFFCRGVRNYIGTAWEVNDVGAIEFARILYERFVPDQTGKSSGIMDLGNAVSQARVALYKQSAKYGALWAAYQHYGDPTFEL
jgi:CHAT domain